MKLVFWLLHYGTAEKRLDKRPSAEASSQYQIV